MAKVTPAFLTAQAGLWLARIFVTAVLLAALAWLGHFPMGSADNSGLLRLAWRMAGAQVRICTERSEEELLKLPVHMRQKQACEDHAIPYRLALRVNGEPRIDRLVRPRGAKGDRPIYVQEELELPPGEYALSLEFAPAAGDAGKGERERERARTERDDHDEEHGAERHQSDEHETLREAIAKAPRYRLERSVRTRAGRITLIELDESSHTLKVHGP